MINKAELRLDKLVSIERWQHFQDLCSDIFGITISTLDLTGKPILNKSGSKNLCEFVHSFQSSNDKIGNSCIDMEEYTSAKNCVTRYKCPLDLDLYVFPITTHEDNVVAYMSIGPLILKKRRSESFYFERAEEIGVPLEKLLDSLIEVNVFSHGKISRIINLIEGLFLHIAHAGYDKKRLGDITHEIVKSDPQFRNFYEQKILDSLLKTCTIALDADSGSVMTVNKSKQLNIVSATRLDKKIIENTDIKIGEGLAGKVAETAESIILPKDSNNKDISRNMNRDYIKSSMIVPFTKVNSDNVYGVINLNITRKDKEFTEKDISLTKELVNLASIALTAIK